jgi:hypothetical protein
MTNRSFKLARMCGNCHTIKYRQQRPGDAEPGSAVNDLTRLLQCCLNQLNALIFAYVFPVEVGTRTSVTYLFLIRRLLSLRTHLLGCQLCFHPLVKELVDRHILGQTLAPSSL